MENSSIILARWRPLSPYLNQRQRTLWASAEAETIGSGGVALLSSITGISKPTISEGTHKVRATNGSAPGSLIPSRGGHRAGRKPVEMHDPQLEQSLQQMLSEEIAGDPMTHQRWIRSSLRNLSRRLDLQGHKACTHTVGRLLRKMGYSLRANKKRQAGAQHPDRDEQFRYIAALKAQFLREALPVVSIDTKKKELIGNYRREGKSWVREPIETESYFGDYPKCVAVPFGIYDIAHNSGYVTVGISNNTSEFAVNCLESWWRFHGRSAYQHSHRLLVLADGGGANGYNLKTWKKDLQEKLCDAFGLTVTLSHYPPGCSKWNPVEYRLFSHISMNWAGQPLRSLEVMLALIRGTTTTAGLIVEAELDQRVYQKGRQVTEKQLKGLALRTHDVCPRWNYTLTPRATPNSLMCPLVTLQTK
jgi:Rhodopirellula transposase DDE domain